MAIEAAVIVLGLSAFFGRAGWKRMTAGRRARRLALGRTTLHSALEADDGEQLDLAALADLPRRMQITVLAEVAPSLSGESRQRLTQVAEELGLLAHAANRCHSRLWWRRLQGARLFTLLGSGDTVMPALLGDRHPEVRAQAARWAMEHHDDEILERLLGILDRDEASTRFAVRDALIRIGRPVTERLARHLAAPAGASRIPALEVAVALADPVLLPVGLKLCGDETQAVRALAARLVAAVGGSEVMDVLVRMLGDDAPEVRAAAARSLGKAGHWPAAASLAAMLADRSWEVRRQAGIALRSLGSPGMLFLRRALSAEDPFAADAARQMLDMPDSTTRALQR